MSAPRFDPRTQSQIDAIRAFNRFYTRRIGVLREGLLASRFSLTESRLLWEFAHCEALTASELARELELDPGYLSRLLRGFKEQGLIKAVAARGDARRQQLSITAAGRKAFAPLDERSQAEIGTLLATLAPAARAELIAATSTIARLLGADESKAAPFIIRPFAPGDMGWIISRHGALYAQEFGWDASFEALVARIGAKLIDEFDPKREQCWIAERDGVNIGSVALVQMRDEATNKIERGVAQLRILIVDPSARGLGVGKALVREAERFARRAGYKKIRLWTHSVLLAARSIYRAVGYEIVATEPHHSFGKDLVAETWELAL